jgi:acid stress chaperone HdeB
MRRPAAACKAPVRGRFGGDLAKCHRPPSGCAGRWCMGLCAGGDAFGAAPPILFANGSRAMNMFSRVCLTLPVMAFAILPARAQVTVDVSKITCEQYVLFTVADPHDIAMWLSGYYNGKKSNTVLDTQQFREHAKQVMDYCQLNLKTPVMEAAEKVLGIPK